MKKFQPKPLKPQLNTCLKTPNPEGFWMTLKTRQDISVRLPPARGRDPPWDPSSNSNISATNRSYPKSFRIWSFQTDVVSRFQGFGLKLSHLEEISVQSWKVGGEFDISTAFIKEPLYTLISPPGPFPLKTSLNIGFWRNVM